ncbi:hypothetical protein UlMin_021277 [Ulmus minor]
MGLFMSIMGGGSVYTKMVDIVTGTLYDEFVKPKMENPDDFSVAVLDIFNAFNSALPGKHYVVPDRERVKELYWQWINAKDERERKHCFVQFMMKNVNLNKIDRVTMITGIVTPPAAMVAKRAGEVVPQLKMIKSIPDVLFVPSATVLALFSVKITRRALMGKQASSKLSS